MVSVPKSAPSQPRLRATSASPRIPAWSITTPSAPSVMRWSWISHGTCAQDSVVGLGAGVVGAENQRSCSRRGLQEGGDEAVVGQGQHRRDRNQEIRRRVEGGGDDGRVPAMDRPTDDDRAHRGIGQGLNSRRRAVFGQTPELDRRGFAELEQPVVRRVQDDHRRREVLARVGVPDGQLVLGRGLAGLARRAPGERYQRGQSDRSPR